MDFSGVKKDVEKMHFIQQDAKRKYGWICWECSWAESVGEKGPEVAVMRDISGSEVRLDVCPSCGSMNVIFGVL